MFASYEEDYESYAAQISRRISELSADAGDAQARKATARKARNLVNEAQQCLRSMEIEARSQPPNVRRGMTEKISQAQNDLANLQRDLQRALQQAERASLMRGSTPEDELGQKSRDQRDRSRQLTQKANRQTAMLEQTRRTLAETEDVGVNVMADLHTQRETLLRAHNKVKEQITLTSRARKLLTGMKARACTNKLMLWGIIIILLGLIGVVLYFGIKKF